MPNFGKFARRFVACLIIVSGWSANVTAWAAEPYVRIVTWNIREMFDVQEVKSRASHLRRFSESVRPDVLMLQEVTSQEVAEAVRDAMGLGSATVLCTDFEQPDTNKHDSFEIALISRFPLDSAVEYDTTPDGAGKGMEEKKLESPLPLSVSPSEIHRGYLKARIPDLNMVVFVVHLKSSRGAVGETDIVNAEMREFVAGSVVTEIKQNATTPAPVFLVAGDFNTGHSDKKKLGKDLKVDSLTFDGRDLYDDTHAILGEGLLGNPKMVNVALSLTKGTFARGFTDTGPIDNIFVSSESSKRFTPITRGREPYNSDHFPIWTDLRGVAPALAQADVPASKPKKSDNVIPDDPAEWSQFPKIEPEQGPDYYEKVVRVELTIRSGKIFDKGFALLNSETDFRSKKNLTILLQEEIVEELQKEAGGDLVSWIKNKKVRMVGTMKEYKKRPELELAKRAHLQILSEKSN